MLELKNITLQLKEKTLIQPFSIDIAAGEIVVLMGSSGSGKSSILSYIGGDLDEAFSASGEILLNMISMQNIEPEQRRIGRLFQDDLLFPHMTVGENLLFAIPPNPDRISIMQTGLHRMELDGFESRPPHTLSGGQRSRVALMRALLAKPNAILLDEPFSKLDHELRTSMRDYTFAHLQERNIPALLVTHDINDAPAQARILKINHDGSVTNV